MKRLVLLRHGRTAWNAEGRAQGHIDPVPLDDVGERQAAQVAPLIAAMSPTGLWSSDLMRANQTATVIAAATGLSVTTDPRLREYDVGVRGGLTMTEFAQRYPGAYEAWRAGDITGGAEGAETPAEVTGRMVPALREVWEKTPDDGLAVVVSHGAAIRTCVVNLLGWDGVHAWTLGSLDNCGWVVLAEGAYRPGMYLESYNERANGHVATPDFASDDPVG